MDRITKGIIAAVAVAFFLIGLNIGNDPDQRSESNELPEFKTTTPTAGQSSNSLRDFNSAIVDIAERTNPTVVTINTTQTVRQRQRSPFSFFFDDPRFDQEREFQRQGLGSGVIVSEDGYIITNNHVIDNADKIKITLYNGDELDAEIIGTDPASDIAVLKIDHNNLSAIPLGDSDELRVGEMVLAIGSPLGNQFAHSVSMGIVSASGRSGLRLNDFENYIQTDAAINPGNSGGPLINVDGELIGINTAIASRSGGNQGLGFAIPINMARNVMEALITDGRVARGYLGISLGGEVDRTMARALGMENPRGFVIGDVVEDGPAAKAGLQEGDVVVELNGQRVRDFYDFRVTIANSQPGTEVDITVFRDGETKKFTVKLGELDTEQIAEEMSSSDREELREQLGFTVVELTDNIRRQLNLQSQAFGVVVSEINESSGAYSQGLRRGDVISQVAGTSVTQPDEFYGAVQALIDEGNEVALLRVNRQGRNIFVAFEL
ncbi:DegQ family serine endoprotease [Rhodohalobacter halophilus]|uniref:DegQ family serine endoprotease n=1 Tax=Rhodohalobacter halophilus TaxID=1812810 RepID=UPI00083F98A6|nr:DegQ family serine endoprotease [Rhodohalobacter halophilus]